MHGVLKLACMIDGNRTYNRTDSVRAYMYMHVGFMCSPGLGDGTITSHTVSLRVYVKSVTKYIPI